MGRLLAIDFGDKRVGLALSDPMHIIAKPYKTENLNVEIIKKDYFHVALPQSSLLLKKKKEITQQ